MCPQRHPEFICKLTGWEMHIHEKKIKAVVIYTFLLSAIVGQHVRINTEEKTASAAQSHSQREIL
jgi:hypothetical protein